MIVLQPPLVQHEPCFGNAQPHIYRPALTREKTGKRMVRELIDKVYEGSALSLVLQALSASKASPADLAEVRKLLDSLEGK